MEAFNPARDRGLPTTVVLRGPHQTSPAPLAPLNVDTTTLDVAVLPPPSPGGKTPACPHHEVEVSIVFNCGAHAGVVVDELVAGHHAVLVFWGVEGVQKASKDLIQSPLPGEKFGMLFGSCPKRHWKKIGGTVITDDVKCYKNW